MNEIQPSYEHESQASSTTLLQQTAHAQPRRCAALPGGPHPAAQPARRVEESASNFLRRTGRARSLCGGAGLRRL
eukprot:4298425-Pleurochrysis_carterae.AAC.4